MSSWKILCPLLNFSFEKKNILFCIKRVKNRSNIFSFIHPSIPKNLYCKYICGGCIVFPFSPVTIFYLCFFFISAALASIQFGCGGYFSDFQDTNMCTGLLWLSGSHFFYYDKTWHGKIKIISKAKSFRLLVILQIDKQKD